MKTETLPIPVELASWRPQCALRELEMWNGNGERDYRPPPCRNPATLAVIVHNRCHTTVSCRACFLALSAAACRRMGPKGEFLCVGCGQTSPFLSHMLRAVPL